MKILMPFIKLILKDWAWLVLGSLLGFITLLAGIGLLSLSGWFIASAAYAGLNAATATAFNYFLPAGGVRFFSLTRIVGRYGERVFTHEATFKILTRLRVWVYQHIEPLAPGLLLDYRSGDLLNRLVGDVDAMDNLYIRVLTPTLLAFIISLVLLIFLHFISVTLAWLVFTLFLIAGFTIPLIAFAKGNLYGQKVQTISADMRAKIVEYAQSLYELKVFLADETKISRILFENKKLVAAQKKMASIKGLVIALVTFATGLTMWLALYFGIQLVQSHSLNGASLALVVLAIMAAFEAILPLPLAFQYLGKTMTAAKRLLATIETPAPITFPKKTEHDITSTDIVFNTVNFAYQDIPILTNFNLTIRCGEKLGISGPTGIGKTTLLHLLTRSYDPQQGTISIGDINLREFSEPDLRNLIAVITQGPYIFNSTVRDNLLISKPEATDEELFAALQNVQLASFIKELPKGLNTWVGEQGKRLSGGQIQRLSVARAILHDAPIWILDEPTEGLDTTTRDKMLEAIFPLMSGKTVIMISHNEKVLAYVDKIFKLPILRCV